MLIRSVYVGAAVLQQLHQLHVALQGCQVQRCSATLRACRESSPPSHYQTCHPLTPLMHAPTMRLRAIMSWHLHPRGAHRGRAGHHCRYSNALGSFIMASNKDLVCRPRPCTQRK